MPVLASHSVSYGLGALAYLVLLALLFPYRLRRPADAGVLAVTASTMLLSSALYAIVPPVQSGIGWTTGLTELLRSLSWLLLILYFSGLRLPENRLLQIGASSLLGVAVAGLLPAYAGMVLRLALAVLGLILVEQLYRATAPGARWGIKYICIAGGASFAYDFYLYSDALLFHRLQGELWAARGAVNALAALPLAISFTRQPGRQLSLQLSRQLLARSVALLGSAIYLLGMATSAWYLRYVGGPWGAMMQLVCLAGALLLLLSLLFSGTARACLRVWVSKHFYRGHFDYRHEWQQLTSALAAGEAPLRERAIQALAALIESPAGVLWLNDGQGGYHLAHCWNMRPPAQVLTMHSPLCQQMRDKGWVCDATTLGWPGLFCAIPLLFEQQLLGVVALAPPRVAISLDWERRDMLKIAALQAASYLAQQAAAERLTVARQFESVNRMATFIAHDLKNLTLQLALLLKNAQRHHDNPAFRIDMLATLEHSLARMQQLLRKLQRDPEHTRSATLQLDQVLAEVLALHGQARPRPELNIRHSGLQVRADAERLARIIGHLVQNAIEATPAEGWVRLTLTRQREQALIELSDSGRGMPAHFIAHALFQPFMSTKSNGMGIGVFESREYAQELGGRLEVESREGYGTTFRLLLPLHSAVAAA